MRVAQELHIEKGATLLANNDFAAWGNGSVGSAIITAVELGMLRFGDTPLLAASARDTVRVTAWRGCYLRSSS